MKCTRYSPSIVFNSQHFKISASLRKKKKTHTPQNKKKNRLLFIVIITIVVYLTLTHPQLAKNGNNTLAHRHKLSSRRQ